MPGLGNHSRSYALSAASASIVIAPPPVSLWARRIQNEQYPRRQDTLYRASNDVTHHSSSSNDDDHSSSNGNDHSSSNDHHHHNHNHLRADSSVLGLERPRIMSRAHVAAPTTPTLQPHSPTSVYSTCSADHLHPLHSPPASPPASLPASPYASPYAISRLAPTPDDYARPPHARLPQRLSARMPLEMLPRAHWLSRLRSCLRLLIIVLSGAVVSMLLHTLGIYRGNRYLELRKGEIPMVWPAHTNLAPTIILTAVAAANFLASVAILSLSFKRSFRRPIRSRDLYRIVAGSFGVVLWAAALVVFHLLDRASKASLARYSCTNASRITNGRYQYRAVCEEQSVAFYTAVGAASAELLTLITLAASAIKSMRDEPALPTIQIHEKKDSRHLSSAWRPTRPKTWIQ